jgi:hypothetical protein
VDDFLGWEVHGPPRAYRGKFARGADARFVAAARTDIPALLTALAAVTAERDALRAALEGLVTDPPTHEEHFTLICVYCGYPDHVPSCPIVRGRAALGDAGAAFDALLTAEEGAPEPDAATPPGDPALLDAAFRRVRAAREGDAP